MSGRKAIEGFGLYGHEDIDMVYGRHSKIANGAFEECKAMPKGNDVVNVDPEKSSEETVASEDVPEMQTIEQSSRFPVTTGNEMFSNTDFPLLI